MEVTADSLRRRYSATPTEELVELHRTAELTKIASTVIEEVLAARGAVIDEDEPPEQDLDEHPPLATVGSRMVAQILDVMVGWLALLPALALSFVGVWHQIPWFLGLFACLAYVLFQDALPNGQSLGKRVLGIAVVDKTSGEACTTSSSLLRNTCLIFLSIIDLLFLSSEHRQRLGDMAANTIVVKVNPRPAPRSFTID